MLDLASVRRRGPPSSVCSCSGSVVEGARGTRELDGYTLDPAPLVGDLEFPDSTVAGESFRLRAEPDSLFLVDFVHTGSVFVVDDAGGVVLVWTFGISADDLTSDLSQLLDQP